ncbi:MAG: LysR substrate-binding domain-containing protein, partial [Hyphomicrobiaceae bacterium]
PEQIAIGAPLSLWHGFLLDWVSGLRGAMPGLAVSGVGDEPAVLMQRLIGGTLDIALLYRPSPPPGFIMEHLFDEEFVLVSPPRGSGGSSGGRSGARAGGRSGRRREADDYVLIDWGADFLVDHAAAYPERSNPALRLALGPMGLDYVMANGASAYFPSRMVRRLVHDGLLRQPKRRRKFTYPVYMVFAEARNEESFEPLIERLRHAAQKFRQTR